MDKRIVIQRGDRVKLARAMRCTVQMVSYSLNYAKDTELARKIRHVATHEYGGVEVGG